MSGTTHGARTDSRETLVFGTILIAVGLGAFALNVFPDAGAVIVLIVGVTLLTVFLYTHHYAALVPGGIMTGLGAGILVSNQAAIADTDTGGWIVAGLGLGFVSIWAIGGLTRIAEHHPWPLVPGLILTTIGVALLVGGMAIDLLRFWPVLLIALGLLVLWRGVVEARVRR
jgi:hypothetical protein